MEDLSPLAMYALHKARLIPQSTQLYHLHDEDESAGDAGQQFMFTDNDIKVE